jgi:hypothetical protein
LITEICPICDSQNWFLPEGKNLWECKNCSPQKNEAEEIFLHRESEKICDRCHGGNFWLPKNSETWRCEKCSPPASQFFVSQRTGQAPQLPAADSVPLASPSVHMLDRFDVTYCMPWCESCGSWQGVETWWSDGTAETSCRICRAAMPARPMIKQLEE